MAKARLSWAGVEGIGWGDAVHNFYAREVHEEPGDTPSGAPEPEPVAAGRP